MVCFQTKNPDLGKFCRLLLWKILVYFMTIWFILQSFQIFYCHLVYFVVIWYISPILVFRTKKNLATLNVTNFFRNDYLITFVCKRRSTEGSFKLVCISKNLKRDRFLELALAFHSFHLKQFIASWLVPGLVCVYWRQLIAQVRINGCVWGGSSIHLQILRCQNQSSKGPAIESCKNGAIIFTCQIYSNFRGRGARRPPQT
jgi:hypothetical protein